MKHPVLLVTNSSTEALRIHIYNKGDRLFWISWEARVVEPGSSEYLYYDGKPFQYDVHKLVEPRLDALTEVTLLEGRSEKVFYLSGGVSRAELSLDDSEFLRLMQVVVKRRSVSKLDLYATLELDFEELWKFPEEVQQSKIKCKFREMLVRHHPDRHMLDPRRMEHEHITKRVILANRVLSSPEAKKDYDRFLRNQSVCSRCYWSQLWEDMQSADMKWWIQFGIASVSVVAGLGIMIGTAGAAAPAVMIAGAAVGGGLIGGGFVCTKKTLSLDVRERGHQYWCQFGVQFGLGAVAGGVTGGAGAAAQAAIVGVGAAVTQTAGAYAAVGAISGGTGGATFGALEEVFDNEDWTAGSLARAGCIGGASAAALGSVGGAIGGAWAGKFADEVAEGIAISGGRKLIAGSLRGAAEAASGKLTHGTMQAVCERSDQTTDQCFEKDVQRARDIVEDVGVGAILGAIRVHLQLRRPSA